jgi:hypothetical protein
MELLVVDWNLTTGYEELISKVLATTTTLVEFATSIAAGIAPVALPPAFPETLPYLEPVPDTLRNE